METWPALAKWQDLQYLSRMAGHRTVPVEVGSQVVCRCELCDAVAVVFMMLLLAFKLSLLRGFYVAMAKELPT